MFPGNLTTKSRGSKNRHSFPWVLIMPQLHLGVPACSQSLVLMAPSGLGAPASGAGQPFVLGALKMVWNTGVGCHGLLQAVCMCICTYTSV